MNDFDSIISSLPIEKLKEYLLAQKESLYESTLLRVLFGDFDIMDADALTLYQNHFILFHILYKLQDDFEKDGLYLHIHFMRIKTIPYPTNKTCRFYNEELGYFCTEEITSNSKYCEFHLKEFDNMIDGLSIKYFYLDKSNFYKLDKENAEAFINGTWEILANYDEFKDSFKKLELNETYDLELIKKQFKFLAKKYHPDISKENHIKFNEINNAYRMITRMIPVFKK
jgi:hypothetical protein